jgi:hypothetical protein
MDYHADARNLDANEGVFFKKQLEVIATKTFDTIYADLKALNGIFPIVANPQLVAASEYTWRAFSKVGMAKMIADYAKDFPRADLYGAETSRKIKDIGASYGYSIKEIRRAALAGFALEARRADACKQSIDTKLNDVALNGDSTHNIPGFLDCTNFTEYTTPSGAASGATRAWSTKTADEIILDMYGTIAAVQTATSMKERPRNLLLPPAQYIQINNKRMGDGSDTTILGFFKQNNPDITIDWLNELSTGSVTTGGRLIAYNNDPNYVTFEIPVAFEQLGAEKEGATYVVPAMATTAGVIVYRPVAFGYADYIS